MNIQCTPCVHHPNSTIMKKFLPNLHHHLFSFKTITVILLRHSYVLQYTSLKKKKGTFSYITLVPLSYLRKLAVIRWYHLICRPFSNVPQLYQRYLFTVDLLDSVPVSPLVAMPLKTSIQIYRFHFLYVFFSFFLPNIDLLKKNRSFILQGDPYFHVRIQLFPLAFVFSQRLEIILKACLDSGSPFSWQESFQSGSMNFILPHIRRHMMSHSSDTQIDL